MYGINDTVLYGAYGVCKIRDITEKEVDGHKQEYYVLKPVYDGNSTIFLPVHNEKTTEKMRHVLSAEEIYALIKAMPAESTIWIDDEAARKGRYKEILTKGNRAALVMLIKTLYLHQQAQMEKGKKLHAADEHCMKDAEKMLYDEFAHVLDIKREQVLPFIFEQIEVERNNR